MRGIKEYLEIQDTKMKLFSDILFWGICKHYVLQLLKLTEEEEILELIKLSS